MYQRTLENLIVILGYPQSISRSLLVDTMLFLCNIFIRRCNFLKFEHIVNQT